MVSNTVADVRCDCWLFAVVVGWCSSLFVFVVCRWLLLFVAGDVYRYRVLFVAVACCRC